MSSSLWTAITGVAGSVVSGLTGFFDTLINLGTTIKDFTLGFFEQAVDFMSSLFIPSDNYFDTKISNMNENLSSKFDWVTVVKNSIPTSLSDVTSYSIPFIGDTKIDFSWYDGYRTYIKGILSTGMVVLTLFSLVKQLRPKINING